MTFERRKQNCKLKATYVSSNGRRPALLGIVTGNIGERISNDNYSGKNVINKEIIEGICCLSSIKKHYFQHS